MSSKGLHWFTNDIEECCLKECPDGWHQGRLKVSDETKQKMSNSSWMKKISKEELLERNKKIAKTINSRTKEEKEAFSKKVSDNRKGKGLGNIPWNKGVHTEVWNKGISMSEEQKQKLRDKYNSLSEEEKQRRKDAVSKAHKGKTPWNKGLSRKLD